MESIKKKSPAIILKMKALFPTLSKSEKKVVNQIYKDPEKVIHLSVAGLAESCNVSEATVVRTCRTLGLDGYQDLKVTLAQDIVTPLQAINEEISSADTTNVIIDKIFQSTYHTLEFTHDNLKTATIEAAATAIMEAKNVLIIGLGNSHAIALDMVHKFLRLGINAEEFLDSHIQTIRATFLTKDDVLIAISHSGSTKDIVDCAKLAKKNGATVISFTNIGTSPLTKIADIKLYTASNETKYRIVSVDSRIAQMTIVDCIYTLIATREKGAVTEFRKIEAALENKKY
jgi:DNA-binding MurR/RpiR family transcriptional regulator